jgi:hypothetical protein
MTEKRKLPVIVDRAKPNAPAFTPVRWLYPIAVGLPLIVFNCGWIAHSEMKTGVTEMTIQTLFMGVTFLLFLVTLVNLLIGRLFGPRASMNQPELMTLYGMLSMSSVVAGIGNLGFFHAVPGKCLLVRE